MFRNCIKSLLLVLAFYLLCSHAMVSRLNSLSAIRDSLKPVEIMDIEYKNGKYHGYAITLEGSKYPVPHGIGTFTFFPMNIGNMIYHGRWENGKYSGFGTLILDGVIIKEGIFSDNFLIDEEKSHE